MSLGVGKLRSLWESVSAVSMPVFGSQSREKFHAKKATPSVFLRLRVLDLSIFS